MMTKEDYMKLSKERLAEMLVEKDITVSQSPYSFPMTIPHCPFDGGCCTYCGSCTYCPRYNLGTTHYTVTCKIGDKDEK